MKRRADLLIDGKYKRITIWDALDWKKNRPKLWEIYKDNIYSICKKPENKVRMVFQTGKNGIVQNSYFRYYNADFAHKGEGSEESYRHEFFKECISRIKRLEIRWKGEALTIYPDEILREETVIMDDGSKRIVDLLVHFKRAEPSIYVEKWEGQLAIEVNDTHPVDSRKISQMKQKGLSCFEFTVSKWRIRENFSDAEDEEKQIVEITEKLEGENAGYIYGKLLVDSISRKYFSTKLYEDEKREKEKVLAELYQIKKLYGQAIDENKGLRERIQLLDRDINSYKNKLSNLDMKFKMLEQENTKIKSSFWYKLFGKK
ncbi:hypothetical protein H8S17_08205 [Roseburia sp. BX1005]|uniref:Uncharacterized protein n=1 Tax=Roseburia zhanii TaxID=2763064 RepID=A0A923RT13_9FIRM|nr:hypothetical protein [Roseburia zhanii]MBC5714188.1 hypothetical protein [Roseburia zhanii]